MIIIIKVNLEPKPVNTERKYADGYTAASNLKSDANAVGCSQHLLPLSLLTKLLIFNHFFSVLKKSVIASANPQF